MSNNRSIAQRLEAFETLLVNDDVLAAQIRAHLRFTQRLTRIICAFLFLLLCGVALHLIAISF